MNTNSFKWYFKNVEGNYLSDSDDNIVFFENLREAQYFLCNDSLVSPEDRNDIIITLEKPEDYNLPGYKEIEAKTSLYEEYRDSRDRAKSLYDILVGLDDLEEEN